MYFWKTRELSRDIKEEAFPERERKNYYLATTLFLTVGVYLGHIAPPENYLAMLIEAVGVVGITIFGIQITFDSNGGDKGRDYIARMTALSLPLLVKIVVIGLLAGVLMGGYVAVTGDGDAEAWLYSVFVVAVQIGYFWRLNVHIKFINSPAYSEQDAA